MFILLSIYQLNCLFFLIKILVCLSCIGRGTSFCTSSFSFIGNFHQWFSQSQLIACTFNTHQDDIFNSTKYSLLNNFKLPILPLSSTLASWLCQMISHYPFKRTFGAMWTSFCYTRTPQSDLRFISGWHRFKIPVNYSAIGTEINDTNTAARAQ